MLSASTRWNRAASTRPGRVYRTQRAFIAHEDLAQLEAKIDRADCSRSGH
jgi:hypothetical protein